jgi:hypothetical protein
VEEDRRGYDGRGGESYVVTWIHDAVERGHVSFGDLRGGGDGRCWEEIECLFIGSLVNKGSRRMYGVEPC